MPRLDRFYTRDDVAAQCIEIACAAVGFDPAVWLEPSAGAGAFLRLLPYPRIGFDIAPGAPGICRADFLTWIPPPEFPKPVAVIGNPPFGKNSSLAVRFFNAAAAFAEAIAFVVPRTFEKAPLQGRLDRVFVLAVQHPIPPRAFVTPAGEPFDAPCVFQVWRRSATPRPAITPIRAHPDLVFLRDPSEADFALQRVGARAGLISTAGLAKSPNSHYFLRASPQARDRLASIDWSAVKARTAGCPSIGKAEIVAAYSEIAS